MEKIMDMDKFESNINNIFTAALFYKMMEALINKDSTMDIEKLFPEDARKAAEEAEELLKQDGIEVPEGNEFQIGLCYRLAEASLKGEISGVAFAAAVKEELEGNALLTDLRKAVNR